jgi:Zn-dependent protease with chaperone function
VKRIFNGCVVALAMLLAGCGTTTEPGAVGLQRSQLLLVASEEVNQAAAQAYQQVLTQAQQQGALDRDVAKLRRVRTIVARLIPQTGAFRQDAPAWQWEVHVLSSKEINAWCMPGGKIAVYTGLIDSIQPSDDELAAVLGHEMGHALREHSRERVSATMAQQMALDVASAVVDIPPIARDLAPLVLDVTVNLPYSRRQETEADRVGVELAARAAYDPRAAIVLWEKMEKLAGSQPPKLLATHPSPADRMKDLRAYAEKVLPLYLAATGGSPSAGK